MSKKYTTNFLEDTNGSTGSANQVLISTPSGIDWVDGSGSSIIGGPYLPLAGGTMTGNLLLNDNVELRLGTSSDFKAGHTNSYTYMYNYTGHMYLRNFADNSDIIFQTDNNSGGYTSYLVLDGSSGHSYFSNPGNVGIGTTSPGAKLDVSAGTNLNLGIRQLTLDNFSDEGIGMTFSRTSSDADLMAIGVASADKLGVFSRSGIIFSTGGLVQYAQTEERMRIDLDGNVGIGTDSPVNYSGYTTLQIDGSSGSVFRMDRDDNTVQFEQAVVSNSVYYKTITGTDIWFGTNNTERMRIDSSGNVGIGTTSPSGKLEVNTGSSAAYFTRTAGDDGLLNPVVAIAADSSRGLIAASGDSLSFRVRAVGTSNPLGGNTVMSLLPSGNVGIGTTSPGEKLVVNGAVVWQGALGSSQTNSGVLDRSGNDLRIRAYGADAGTGNLVFRTGGGGGSVDSESMRITSGGNVGIGTTSPENKLHVQQSGLYTGIQTTAGIRIKSDGASAIGNYHGTIALSRGTGSVAISAVQEDTDSDIMGMAFFTHPSATGGDAAVEQMRLDQNGNVGIGTTSPQAKLEIRSDGSAAGGAEIRLQHANNSTNDVVSTVNFANNAGSVGMIQSGTAGANNTGYIALFTDIAGSSSERMRVHTNGNVGIGTTSPDAKLDVNGNIRIPNAGKIVFGTAGSPNDYLELNDVFSSGKLLKLVQDGATRFDISGVNGNVYMQGNVGIGTTSPTLAKLEVRDSSTQTGLLITSDGGNEQFKIQRYSNNNEQLILGFHSSDYAQIQAVEQGVAYRTLALNPNGGNVGIGTTDPSSLLHIKGADPILTIQDTSTSTSNASSTLRLGESGVGGVLDVYWDIKQASDNLNTHLEINHSSNGNHFTILDNGNVGIGTTSPDVRLEVVEASPTDGIVADFVNSTNAGGTIAAIKLSNADSESCDVVLGANRVGANFGSDFFISPSDGVDGTNQERLRITEAGAIKFNAYNSTNNTGTPTYLLGTDASGNIVKTNTIPGSAAGPYLPLAGGTMTGDLLMDGKAGVGNVIGLATGTSSDAMSLKLYTYNNIDPGGGLGTSTGNMIQADLGSNLVLRQTANDGDITFQSDDGAGGIATYLTLDGSSTDAYFSNPGNVGIGTTSPAVQLELGDNTADEKLRLTGAASGKPLMTFYNTTTKIGQIASSSVGVTVTSLGSGNMSFENGGNNRLVIDNSGNVGIADTSPSYKLDVDGTIRATGDVIAYSDIRVKENIKTIDNAVSKVNKLRGVEFNKIGSEEKSIGVIAQEIEKVLPEVVKEDDKGMKSVAYGNIVGVLIEAIKDQQKQIDELKSIINGSTK